MNLSTNEVAATVPVHSTAERRGLVVVAPAPAATARAAASHAATSDATVPAEHVDSAALDAAVKALNDRYAQLRTDLRFSVDSSTGRTVVAVVDSEDGTVLRQIPSEEVMRIAHVLTNTRGALIRRTA